MIVDQLQGLQEYSDRIPHIKAALETFNSLAQKAIGRYDFEGGYFFIQDGELGAVDASHYEAHQKWLDIHVPLVGHEYLIVAPTCQLNEVTAYDAEKDIAFLDGPIQTIVKLYPGQACVVFPEDAHKPARHLGQVSAYKKLVIKLPVA